MVCKKLELLVGERGACGNVAHGDSERGFADRRKGVTRIGVQLDVQNVAGGDEKLALAKQAVNHVVASQSKIMDSAFVCVLEDDAELTPPRLDFST